MLSNQEIVLVYEAVAKITDQILAAARCENWSEVERLESDCNAQLLLIKNKARPSDPITGALRDRKLKSIRKILADDREIRELVQPWSVRLSSLINGRDAERHRPHRRAD